MECQTCISGSLFIPFVRVAHRKCWDTSDVVRLDQTCQACMTNHVAGRASVRQVRTDVSLVRRVTWPTMLLAEPVYDRFVLMSAWSDASHDQPCSRPSQCTPGRYRHLKDDPLTFDFKVKSKSVAAGRLKGIRTIKINPWRNFKLQ